MANSELEKSVASRHFLNICELSDDDLNGLLTRTLALAQGAAPGPQRRTICNLFYEPSTRTRVSFELAAQALSASVVTIEAARSSASKGETLNDTAATLQAMGVDALVVRHPEAGALASLASSLSTSLQLVNAGDGAQGHPSQALLDAATLQASGLDWSNASVAIVGDIGHSRVARSGLQLFERLGLGQIRLAGPESLLPESLLSDWDCGPNVLRARSLSDAVSDADAIMMLRVQHERFDQTAWPNPEDYAKEWCLRAEHLALARSDCRILHPGPINRGMEIESTVADGPQSLILDQVRMGVFARTAIFEWLFAQ